MIAALPTSSWTRADYDAHQALNQTAGKLVTNETVTSEEYDAAIEAWLNATHPKASTL